MPSRTPSRQPSADSHALLEILAARRMGGPHAIKGFIYQTHYAVWRLLHELLPEEVNQKVEPVDPDSDQGGESSEPVDSSPSPEIQTTILLEGLEDVDVIQITRLQGAETNRTRECVQAKCSLNTWNADSFWETGMLQNFAEAYLLDPTLKFHIVHSASLPQSGALAALAHSTQTGQPLTGVPFHYWRNKFLFYQQEKGLNWPNFSLTDFFARITFEHIQDRVLEAGIRSQINNKLSIPDGAEGPYANALKWSTLRWSRDKREVTTEVVRTLIDELTESIRQGVEHILTSDELIQPVSFEPVPSAKAEDYFEGKAARPFHIAAELPARREDWEKHILEVFDQNDVTVIRASSGQGKSTLAWRVVRELSGKGWTPYEILRCQNPRDVTHLQRFLELRVRLGEMPLLVFDGLRSDLSAWNELANQIRHLPVKMMVTSREEDWYRFGADPSQLRLRPVSIEMSKEEAEAIYESFKERGKIHPNVPEWQVAWERVQDPGLLIEFIVLITSGQMLEERIDAQVKALTGTPDSAARLEILRLVSLAHVCGIRLSTSELLAHVRENVGFQGDRGEALASLREEYYVGLDRNAVLMGLHPVRSEHLLDRLHRSLPLKDTLVGILPMVASADILNFCAQAPLMLDEADRGSFLTALAQHCVERPPVDMVRAVEGTFVADAFLHLEMNRALYDRIESDLGSNLHAFVVIGSALLRLDRWFEIKKGLSQLANSEAILTQIRAFEPDYSLTVQLLRPLQSALTESIALLDHPSPMTVLEFWFRKFDLPSPVVGHLSPEEIWSLVETHGVERVDMLFYFLYKFFPDTYKVIVSTHRSELIDRICDAAGILRMQESEEKLYIEFFIDKPDLIGDKKSLPQLSMPFRFFPHYKEYIAPGLLPTWIARRLPFLLVPDHPLNRISSTEFTDFFRDRLIKLWSGTILREYELPSVYEWQQHWFQLRQRSVRLAQMICELYEASIGGSELPLARMDALNELRSQVLDDLMSFKGLRSNLGSGSDLDPFSIRLFKEQQSTLEQWELLWRSFLIDLFDLLVRKSDSDQSFHGFHRAIRIHLNPFQTAYREVLGQTSTYFEPSDLEQQEREWYGRLSDLALYFHSYKPAGVALKNPLEEARKVFEQIDRRILAQIRTQVALIQQKANLRIVVGDEIVLEDVFLKEPPYRMGVLAVEFPISVHPSILFSKLAPLQEVKGISGFCVHLIDDNGFVRSSYYRVFMNHLKTVSPDLSDSNLPLSLPSRDQLLSLLPGVQRAPVEAYHESLQSESMGLFELFTDVWKIGEVRRCLSYEPNSERLQALEDGLKAKCVQNLATFRAGVDNQYFEPVALTLEAMFQGRESISDDSLMIIARYLNIG